MRLNAEGVRKCSTTFFLASSRLELGAVHNDAVRAKMDRLVTISKLFETVQT